MNTGTLKTRLVITNDNRLIVGDDDAFTIERSARISDGDGKALTIAGQNGKGNNANGGDIIFRVGASTGDGDKGQFKVVTETNTPVLTIDENQFVLTTEIIDLSQGSKIVYLKNNHASAITFQKKGTQQIF